MTHFPHHERVPSLPNGRPAAPFGHRTLHLKGGRSDAPKEVAGKATPVLEDQKWWFFTWLTLGETYRKMWKTTMENQFGE